MLRLGGRAVELYAAQILITMIAIAMLAAELPGDTTVFPGHMGMTTLATEQQSNPFLASAR